MNGVAVGAGLDLALVCDIRIASEGVKFGEAYVCVGGVPDSGGTNHLQPDPYWKHFCQAIEREDIENDPRFNSLSTRSENSAVLINIIDEAFAKRTLEEWKVRLLKFGLIFSPVQKPTEVVNDPQARANDFFETFTHPVYGPIELVAAPIKLSETLGVLRTPAPEFGQHTEEILLELGYSWDEISWLRDKKVIA